MFVEKPLAASSDDARGLIRTAYERGLVLMPGHTFLYSPPVIRIRDLIRSGELGEIYFISMSRVNLGLHQSDVSVIWDLGPHDFSILLYWLGETPRRVVSMGRACIVHGQEDVAFINCEFDSGAIAHIELSWLAPSKLRRTTVVGSKKMVVYDDCSNEPVRVYDSGVMPRNPESFGEYLNYRTGDIVSPHIDRDEPIALQMEDFCARSPLRLDPPLVAAARARGRAHDRGGGALAQLCNSCADSTAVMQAGCRDGASAALGLR